MLTILISFAHALGSWYFFSSTLLTLEYIALLHPQIGLSNFLLFSARRVFRIIYNYFTELSLVEYSSRRELLAVFRIHFITQARHDAFDFLAGVDASNLFIYRHLRGAEGGQQVKQPFI